MNSSLYVKVNYVVFEKKQYKVIPVKSDYLALLQKYRDESNNLACHNFETRMNNLKKSKEKLQKKNLKSLKKLKICMKKF